MFNLKQVKTAFDDDQYGFTKTLISCINQGDKRLSQEINCRIDEVLLDAFKNHSLDAQKVIHNALFMIYQINLAYPLSQAAKLQYDECLVKVKNKIESAWLLDEFKDVDMTNINANHKVYAEFLIDVWQTHNASHHPLFEFLESDATPEQLYLFLKSDSALNLIFFDLVAYTLIGAQPETRGTISENIWDEVGHGDNYFTHVNLYKDVLERRGIILPDNHYIDLYGVEALAGHNAFMLGGVNRAHYYKLLGVMAMTEVLDPPQYAKLVMGCSRLGLVDRDFHYYSEHITIDVKHGEDWLYKVINVITDQYPESKDEFYYGSLLRLRTAERYYDHLLKEIKKL